MLDSHDLEKCSAFTETMMERVRVSVEIAHFKVGQENFFTHTFLPLYNKWLKDIQRVSSKIRILSKHLD